MDKPAYPTHPEIRAWALRRAEDLDRREFGNALKTVGPRKPLGGQGFESFFKAVWAGIKLRRRGLAVQLVRGQISWWIYAWDRAALEQLLRVNATLLLACDWPHGPKGFVDRVRRSDLLVSPQTRLFDLVADAYGDKTGPGRTDVLAGWPRRDLLEGFAAVVGSPEPTTVYFDD